MDPVAYLSGADVDDTDNGAADGMGGMGGGMPGSGGMGGFGSASGSGSGSGLGVLLHTACETTVFNLGQCHRKVSERSVE